MSQSKILIHEMSYHLTSGIPLLKSLELSLAQHKIGLVGRNGVGKSTLLQLIAGNLQPLSGSIYVDGTIVYIPQNPVVSHDMTVARLFDLEDKIQALERIELGSIDLVDYEILGDDWECKQRLYYQLQFLDLSHIHHNKSLITCSGGELTRLLLAKAFHANADFLLLDEPTNHLDNHARQAFYAAIQQWQDGVIVASHDRTLLNLMDQIIEISQASANIYGGNYDAYVEQKEIADAAHAQQLDDAIKYFEKNKTSIQSSKEKHQRKSSYGRKLRESGSIDKLSAGSKKGRSERSQSTMRIKEKRMLEDAEKKLQSAKDNIEIYDVIDIELSKTHVPAGKTIVDIHKLAFMYQGSEHKILSDFNLKIVGPERIAISGPNGSGKSTLMKLLQGIISPVEGEIFLGTHYVCFVDQYASLLDSNLSVIDNFLRLNPDATRNYAYRCLAKFLFKNIGADKKVSELSGGQKMRALLACTLMASHPPQLLLLDEPTNHLDVDSMKSVESALKAYQGALIVISHDQSFLNNIKISRVVSL